MVVYLSSLKVRSIHNLYGGLWLGVLLEGICDSVVARVCVCDCIRDEAGAGCPSPEPNTNQSPVGQQCFTTTLTQTVLWLRTPCTTCRQRQAFNMHFRVVSKNEMYYIEIHAYIMYALYVLQSLHVIISVRVCFVCASVC